EQELYPCPRCKKVYRWMISLRRHIRLECGQEPKHPCLYCGRRDNQMDGDMGWIDGLAWLPLGNNTLESTEQAVSYTKTASVVSQQSTRLGFPSVGVVQNLSNTDLSADGFSYVCPKCHKRYRWRDSLRRHQRVECGLEPKHACPTCGRMFKHKHQMVVHGRIHHS
ncbi:Longitudinals lacking protein, isoforms F/I/K/T, partial [Zootermopsis nevadensis]